MAKKELIENESDDDQSVEIPVSKAKNPPRNKNLELARAKALEVRQARATKKKVIKNIQSDKLELQYQAAQKELEELKAKLSGQQELQIEPPCEVEQPPVEKEHEPNSIVKKEKKRPPKIVYKGEEDSDSEVEQKIVIKMKKSKSKKTKNNDNDEYEYIDEDQYHQQQQQNEINNQNQLQQQEQDQYNNSIIEARKKAHAYLNGGYYY